jgi:cellulose synthase/poly-beta-1,6-N-acetylglucosamine synthase-like glycosyltransferase
MLFLFWISLFAIFYAYVGYPLLLFFISIFFKSESSSETLKELPSVSLLISVYNEEKVIGDKIENSLALNYPGELLEIVVISDSSDDRTDEIVSRCVDRGVILRSYPGRIGKTACLNKAVPIAKGDIIVFSDANSKYERNAIRELVKHFSDERIGFVTGHTQYVSETDREKVLPIGVYSRIERLTKKLESVISSCIGADGAIFAIRKELYEPLSDSDINDFVIPLQIIRKGFRGVIEEKAICVEETAKGTKGEYDRQVRITNRTIRALFQNADMLNPLKYGFFSFELFSHKLLKFLTPYFVIALFTANIFLLIDGTFYLMTFIGQILFYSLAALGYIRKYRKGISKLIFFSETFAMANLAILMGWMNFIKGETFVTWTKDR